MGEKPTFFQSQVAHFVGGYLERERETACGTASPQPQGNGRILSGSRRVESALCLPGVPQQETSHDCGFFIMEMVLRTLQLTPDALRELATASSVEIAMLPWPSQQQILRRKEMLREIVDKLFAAARRHGTGDVEALIKAQPELRGQVRAALLDGGPNFTHGFDRWAAGDWDLSPSPSRSRSRGKEKPEKRKSATNKRGSKTRSDSGSSGRSRKRRRKRKKGRGSSSEDDEEGSRERRRRRRRSRSSSGSRSGGSAKSSSKDKDDKRVPEKVPEKVPERPPPPAPLSRQDLETLSVGALRKHCVQRGVLPPGIVERTDLQAALAKFATAAPAQGATARPPPPPPPPQEPASRRFTRSGLEAMSTKELKGLCSQKGVLPPPPLERGDLIQALARFAAPG